jgi:hypothetical protein
MIMLHLPSLREAIEKIGCHELYLVEKIYKTMLGFNPYKNKVQI